MEKKMTFRERWEAFPEEARNKIKVWAVAGFGFSIIAEILAQYGVWTWNEKPLPIWLFIVSYAIPGILSYGIYFAFCVLWKIKTKIRSSILNMVLSKIITGITSYIIIFVYGYILGLVTGFMGHDIREYIIDDVVTYSMDSVTVVPGLIATICSVILFHVNTFIYEETDDRTDARQSEGAEKKDAPRKETIADRRRIEALSAECEEIKKKMAAVPVAKIKAMHRDGRMTDEQYRAIAIRYNEMKKRRDEIEDELIRLGAFD